MGVKDHWKSLGRKYYLAEIHALYTFTTQSWTYRRTGTCLPGAYYKLHYLVCLYSFSGHIEALSEDEATELLSNVPLKQGN